ncbi:glycosyltransferase family 4 protein [Bythopirellula polymerisocia]|uniref:Putative glycosyltransferase EpsD n=1 Tax=Bythopirellula polymerisocia TaxID=2528003 RepID=A0A5C6CQA2_9BACT|nr:glycosyltransferase family 4 protein [Bythopirellula polymerisocia]TWU25797.1 putative glycosyltransferase EpsD [Bythopirellula polymerisocia]
MHYAVPRILSQSGMLEHFYTDICATKSWPRLLHVIPNSVRPQGVQSLLSRKPIGVPAKHTTAFTRLGWTRVRNRSKCKTPADESRLHLASNKEFGRLVVDAGFFGADTTFTYNTASLEIMQAAKQQGLTTFMEQTIAPMTIERRLLADESKRHPDWPYSDTADAYDELIAREYAEWEIADHVLCGSEFVKQGIADLGGPAEKCIVVPYGVDTQRPPEKKISHDGPLRILTVGALGLRKGTPYVLEAADTLKGTAVFKLVGPAEGLPTGREFPSNVEICGAVPRSQVTDFYRWADVLLLPSICEGSATVIYESLAAGLPVICTHNAGSVVKDGVDGFLIAATESSAIVTAVMRLASECELLKNLSLNAAEKAKNYSMRRYGERLVKVMKLKMRMPSV